MQIVERSVVIFLLMSRAADTIVRLATKLSAPFVPRIIRRSLAGRPACQMVNILWYQQTVNPFLALFSTSYITKVKWYTSQPHKGLFQSTTNNYLQNLFSILQ